MKTNFSHQKGECTALDVAIMSLVHLLEVPHSTAQSCRINMVALSSSTPLEYRYRYLALSNV